MNRFSNSGFLTHQGISFLIICVLILPSLGQQHRQLDDPGKLSAEFKIAPFLQARLAESGRQSVKESWPVIVQVEPEFFRTQRGSRSQVNSLPLVNGYTARLTSGQIELLAESKQVTYITLDAPLRVTGKGGGNKPDSSGGFLAATGADLAQQLGYDGSGVTVALFDSGIIGAHRDLDVSKVIGRVDFRNGTPIVIPFNYSADKLGHGTHVTGIIGGEGDTSVAPGVKFLDINVINVDGTGLTSSLIAAIDWVIQHKDEYGVKVANLSLGRPALEHYTLDPLGQAVERMVEAGIVTVASAGNLGKTDEHPEIWGSITSPGNHPAVITVGAVNTKGTASHLDDVPTTFASRGPTQDGRIKPDLVAPGNQVPSMSWSTSGLVQEYPELKIDKSHAKLSGSSMATAFVSGTAALMLQANPQLTPRMVKAILMLTAVKLQDAHILEQGNGFLNTYTAVRVAEVVDVPNRVISADVSPYWDLNGEQVVAGGAFAFGDRIAYSSMIDSSVHGEFWGDGLMWADAVLWVDGTFWIDGIFENDSVLWTDSSLGSDTQIWSDGLLWSDSFLQSNALLWMDAILWVDAIFWTDNSIWAESVLWTDTTPTADYVLGDN